MKVYNIKDTDRFFEVLNNCSGDVNIVAKDGTMIPFHKDDTARIMEESCAGVSIPELELKFSDPKDSVDMIIFLGNFRAA